MAAGMIFAALAFGAATLVEVNVMVRPNQHRYHHRLKTRLRFGLENHVTDTAVFINLLLELSILV